MTTLELSFAEIEKARERLDGHIRNTPCMQSKTLSAMLGCEVYLKMENLQFTSSFKERGALRRP
jgi:threonine dehydratase